MQLQLMNSPDLLGDRPFKLFQQDAVEWLRSLPPTTVDCIITDPAYESLEKHRARGTTPRLTNWFPIFKNDRYQELFLEFYRVLKNNSHCYIFCDQETMFIIKPIAEACGFKFWKPIIWDKQSIGMGYHYRCRYECILFFEKGKRKLCDLAIADVLQCKRIVNGYPTEKPPEIIETLITQSTSENEIILDCFMGSGVTGATALQQKRRFIGCDISPTSHASAHPRLLSHAVNPHVQLK
jgi:site-specific DNA-methyltransferase (adenine-specific)